VSDGKTRRFDSTRSQECQKCQHTGSLFAQPDSNGLNNQGTNTKAVPVYRSSEVDPAINEPCGLELERQTMYKQMQEMISDVQIKQKKRAKEKVKFLLFREIHRIF
jgi:hypothetical protein